MIVWTLWSSIIKKGNMKTDESWHIRWFIESNNTEHLSMDNWRNQRNSFYQFFYDGVSCKSKCYHASWHSYTISAIHAVFSHILVPLYAYNGEIGFRFTSKLFRVCSQYILCAIISDPVLGQQCTMYPRSILYWLAI